MRQRSAVIAVALAVAAVWPLLLTSASATASVPADPGTRGIVSSSNWGLAEQVPGLAALSHGQSTELRAVSCGSAGNCSAGGGYATGASQGQAFVDNQVNGTWGTAQAVPGIAVLNRGGGAEIHAVSCASGGNCSAGGSYLDGSGRAQGFVVSETNGTWGTAMKVPGLAALNQGGNAYISSVSCASARNCSMGGFYIDGSGHQQVFVDNQVNGIWGTAQEVPGTAALNQFGYAQLLSLSCGAAGNCSAGGSYIDNLRHQQAFVVNETHGTWRTAQEVPGTAALNPNGYAELRSLSCTAAGACTGGGPAGGHAFVVSETSGTWGPAEVVPGIATLGHPAEVYQVSCASAGNCGATGEYTYLLSGLTRSQVFMATEMNGTWGTAQTLPGIQALNQGDALPYTLSCGAPGNCATGGYYQQGSTLQAFVASQASGTWRTAQGVPGAAALNAGGIAILSTVSCASAGNCSAGGDYTDALGRKQAFVVTETTHT